MNAARPVIRPLSDGDVAAAEELAFVALDEVGQEFGFDMGVRDDARIAFAQARIRHLAASDPQGSVVSEQDGEVTGIGLALRRGPLWFLSLLAVRQGLQGQGTGRLLMDAVLAYADGCDRAMICASPDPKALRRYASAGFDLHAGYEASGVVDRALLPGDLGVRDGDWEHDTELADALITLRRGAPWGSDLQWEQGQGARLHVVDGAGDNQAVAITRRGAVMLLAAASPAAATRVLWAALAEAGQATADGKATVGYLLNNQQWAVRVAVAARLALMPIDTLCTRGALTPPDCYVPSGLFG